MFFTDNIFSPIDQLECFNASIITVMDALTGEILFAEDDGILTSLA